MKVSVFGVGYVGLVQAAVLSEVGHDVVCVDIDSDKISRLKQGQIPIYEPGLTNLVVENARSGRLLFSDDPLVGVRHGEVQFIAVGTPSDAMGAADVTHVLSVAQTIGKHLDHSAVVVTKSTVPVGTGDRVEDVIRQGLSARGKAEQFVAVVSNPEFLKEGAAVADCMKPDRIIIGTDDPIAEDAMRELYAPFNRNHEKVIRMDRRSAELTKYASNGLLATKISFMNEIANLAELLGADIESVRQGMSSDPRIGRHFIYPGVGYGGSCFPKDVQALIRSACSVDYEARILQSVEWRNHQQKHVLFSKICDHYKGALAGKTFALWGLSFKPNTEDMREAPSRVLIEALWKSGAKVRAYDPEAMEEARRLYGDRDDLMLCDSKEAALEDADALVVVTEWQVFQTLDYRLIQTQLTDNVIFDGRNIYDPARLRAWGVNYYSVGRKPVQIGAAGIEPLMIQPVVQPAV